MEFIAVLAVLVPFALGGWVLGIVAYVQARTAGTRIAALERRVAELESSRGDDSREERTRLPAGTGSSRGGSP